MTRIAALLLVVGMFVAAPAVAEPPIVRPMFQAADDPTLVTEITETVRAITVEHPEIRGIRVGSAQLPFGVYAMTNRTGIGFNIQITTNKALLDWLMQQDENAHFHPPLGHCTPVELLASHETAHAIDFAHNKTADTELVALVGDGHTLHNQLSGYSFNDDGTINPPEALAEAFASVRCNGGNSAEQQLAQLLNRSDK